MEASIKKIINRLNLPKVQFADVRITKTDNEWIFYQNGFLRQYGTSLDSHAIGIRVLINGVWGFAGSRILSEANIDQLVKTAINNAEAGSRFSLSPVRFKAMPAVQAEYIHKPQIDHPLN